MVVKGHVKILDMGMPNTSEENTSQATGTALGTPLYMAPEAQCKKCRSLCGYLCCGIDRI